MTYLYRPLAPTLTTLSCAAALLLSAAPASAEETMLLLPIQPLGKSIDAAAADKADKLLSAELHEMESVTVAAWPGGAADAGETLPAAIGDALAAGQFSAARKAALKAPAATRAADAFIEATLRETRASLEAGKDGQAHIADIRSALVLRPSLKAPQGAPESLAAIINKERKALAAGGTGTIALSSSPAGAAVFIDGQAKGKTPATLQSMLPGQHFVRIASPGHQSFGQVVEVVAGKPVTLNATLEPVRSQSADVGTINTALRRGALDPKARAAMTRFAGQDEDIAWVTFGVYHQTKGEAPKLHLYVLDVVREDVMSAGVHELALDDFGADAQAASAAAAVAAIPSDLPDPLYQEEILMVEGLRPESLAAPAPAPARKKTGPASR